MRHLLALAVVLAAQATLEQLGVALDAGQRRPQLVADDREEVVLDPLSPPARAPSAPGGRTTAARSGAPGPPARRPPRPCVGSAPRAADRFGRRWRARPGGGRRPGSARPRASRRRARASRRGRRSGCPLAVAWRVAAVAPTAPISPSPNRGWRPSANARHASTSSPSGPAAAAGSRHCSTSSIVKTRVAPPSTGAEPTAIASSVAVRSSDAPKSRPSRLSSSRSRVCSRSRSSSTSCCLELRVLLRAADDDPAEEAGHDAESQEVGDPNGQRVEARLVQPVAREHDREVHAGHDDRGPHRGAEAEPQRGTEDDEPVQEIEVGRVHRDVDRDRDRGHLDDRADDPDLARREAAQEPEDEDAPGGDHAEDGEKDLDARHRRRDDEQDGGRQRHHPQPNPGELALLGAHPSLELALELVRTIGPGFHDQHCTLASGVRLPYTRRAPERQRATRALSGGVYRGTRGPGHSPNPRGR